MDFSFDHSQIPIIGRKALDLPTLEGEPVREAAPTAAAAGDRERGKVQGGAGDSSHSTLERRHGAEAASLSPGVSLNEHTLCAWKKSGIAQVGRNIVHNL